MKKEKIQIISLSASPKFLDYNSTQIKNLQDQAKKIENHILINFQKVKYEVEKKENIIFIKVPRIKTLFYIYKIKKEIKNHINSKIKTIITAGNPFDLGILGIIFKFILKYPLNIQIHTDLYAKNFIKAKKRHYLYFLISKMTLPFANSIRTVSENTKNILKKKYPNKLIKNIIEIADFSNIKINTEKNKDGLLYLCPSRYDNGKNLENLILAFIDFHKKFPDTKLKIIGGGILEKKLKKLISENSANKYIDLPGWSIDMPNEYTRANYTILTSLFEGYNMSVVQSMYYGTPFLATPFGGSTNLIDHDTGLLAYGFSKENIYKLLVNSHKKINTFNTKKIREKVENLTKENMDIELINIWKNTN